MLHTENITLHTVACGERRHDEIERYASLWVVGIETNEGTAWREAPISYDQASQQATQSRKEVTPVTLDVPDEWGERLLAFFSTYLRRGGDDADETVYNCHRFALWMTGSADISLPGALRNAPTLATIIDRGKKARDALPFGEHGVVADVATKIPLHSVIGLGQTEDVIQRFLHVVSFRGPLRLSSYAEAMSTYDLPGKQRLMYATQEDQREVTEQVA